MYLPNSTSTEPFLLLVATDYGGDGNVGVAVVGCAALRRGSKEGEGVVDEGGREEREWATFGCDGGGGFLIRKNGQQRKGKRDGGEKWGVFFVSSSTVRKRSDETGRIYNK
ncbi:hypothetical protein Acr_08g0016690 [Actinidia rufa]|uniref:Uncharacterized protein n=1 Tax=Actinidia rufa TaxID=165716 RepID=A0A7J0F3T3_9ERIC|nr:hypothetical protein Acr_08g0016690 [Actinidia rufa]